MIVKLKYWVLLIMVFVGSYCNDPVEEERSLNNLIIDPEIEIVDSLVISWIDSLGLLYRITSPRMIQSFHDRAFNQEFPEGFEVNFYNKSGLKALSISAGYANMDEKGIMTLKNDVYIKSENGDVLETSFLIWDTYNRILKTDKLIRLIQAHGDTTFGFGLEANQDFSRFRIKNGFAGTRQFRNIKEQLNLEI